MQFSRSILYIALVAYANAASLTNSAESYESVKAGSPFTITWANANGPVTLLLKNGPSTDLKTVSTIASGQTGTSFTWTPDASLPSGKYAFEIQDSGAPNYSKQFDISGSTAPSSSAPDTYGPGPTSSIGTSAPPYSSGYPSSYIPGHNNVTSTSSYSASAPYTTPYASYTPTNSANGTEPTSEPATSTHSHPSKTSATTVPSDTNSAVGVTSPLAFVLSVMAAFVFLQ